MNYQLLRTILFGALVGLALFWAPFFILKVFLFLLIFGFFFRIFRGRGNGPRGWAFADRIRGMSDEEYANFKQDYRAGCGHRHAENVEPKTQES